ncbi:MAG TPA: hypothetical protein VES95_00225 [Dermatophilaceae bacterium]|nr:hypothetical protein [Dermatophilaceae bacterium]
MGDPDHLLALAARWTAVGQRTVRRAETVAALGAVAWESAAADAFRAELVARVAGLRRLAEDQDDVVQRLLELAEAVEAARRRARHVLDPPW